MDQSKVLEQKLQDAENSIKYMKEEHQSILEGLHNEISTLQQKCSGMMKYSIVTFKIVILLQLILFKIVSCIYASFYRLTIQYYTW